MDEKEEKRITDDWEEEAVDKNTKKDNHLLMVIGIIIGIILAVLFVIYVLPILLFIGIFESIAG